MLCLELLNKVSVDMISILVYMFRNNICMTNALEYFKCCTSK